MSELYSRVPYTASFILFSFFIFLNSYHTASTYSVMYVHVMPVSPYTVLALVLGFIQTNKTKEIK